MGGSYVYTFSVDIPRGILYFGGIFTAPCKNIGQYNISSGVVSCLGVGRVLDEALFVEALCVCSHNERIRM